MEDFIWIIVAVVFGLFSMANKVNQRRQEQTGRSQEPPKWPGPVAGPNPGQGPTWAPPPGPRPGGRLQPKAPEPKKSEPMKREAPKTLVSSDAFSRGLDTEGYSSEGIGSEGIGTEGPGLGDSVEDEVNRFSRESQLMEQRGLRRLSEDLGQTQEAAVVTPSEGTSAQMRADLGDTASLTRAIVMAEVLGKPKALRGRGARRI